MKEDTQKTIGEIHFGDYERDAIHIAVAPVVAAHTLTPGEHVGLVGSNGAARFSPRHIGIVDPFLKDEVKGGQRFWLFLYPNTITSLKHLWTHPEFEAREREEFAKALEGPATEDDEPMEPCAC